MYKVGEEILVKSSDENLWRSRYFKFSEGDTVWCELFVGSKSLLNWPQHKPKVATEEYTLETFPRGVVWLREDDGAEIFLVLCTKGSVVGIIECYLTYKEVLDNWKISTDNCQTWHTAGVPNGWKH